MDLAEADREEQVAVGYRAEAVWMRAEARERAKTDPQEATALLQSAMDLTLKAAAIERHLRGIAPLCAEAC